MRSENPTLFFEHRHLLDAKSARMPYPGDGFVLPFGVARRLLEGNRLTVVTWGAMVERCEEAARLAEEELGGRIWSSVHATTGESDAAGLVDLLDLRTLSPWDREAVLASVKRTNRCLIVHEDGRTNGFGAEIASVVAEEAFHALDSPVRRITSPDIPIPYNIGLMEAVVPGVDSIRKAMVDILRE
jgi:2-oxoisovalerate dehydrogenase E1 component